MFSNILGTLYKKRKSRIAGALALVLIANLPFWLLGQSIFLSRAVFSLDAILALAAAQWHPLAGLFLIACSWALDFIVSLSQTFHFISPIEFIRSTKFAGNISIFEYVTPANLLYASPFIVCLLVLRKLRSLTIGPLPILTIGAALLALDAVNGSSVISNRAVRIERFNVAGSALHAVASAVLQEDTASDLEIKTVVNGGAAELAQKLPAAFAGSTSIVYVIVESLGVHQSAEVNNWLESRLYSPKVSSRYNLQSNIVDSHGGTTLGEMRRLCGLTGSYRRLIESNGDQCLPMIASKLGWHVSGYHGFSKSMFDRISWWPTIGIAQSFFAEELSSKHVNRCGAAFPGICDKDLIAEAFNAAKRPKSFVYALTLETHLPLSPLAIPAELSNICSRRKMGGDVCTLLAHLSLTLAAIADELEQSDDLFNVVVVGDHPPPFASLNSRSQFQAERVPFWTLAAKPKNAPL